jgi:arylsulfatase A-like enzyme
LVGRLALDRGDEAASEPQPVTTLRATLVDSQGRDKSLASIRLQSSAPTSASADLEFSENLAPWAGEFVILELRVESESRFPAVHWSQLEIQGAEPIELAPSTIERKHYNVLVILLDSLRADHIAPYGADVAYTPNLARLAARGVTFENARSNSSWTRPAVGALLTSQLPQALGIHGVFDPLPRDLPFLPAVLRRAGYRTVNATASSMVGPRFGFDRGYVEVHELWDDDVLVRLRQPIPRARWIWNTVFETTIRADPFFIYLHEEDPHTPYSPPRGYRVEAADDYRGRPISATPKEITFVRRNPDGIEPDEIAHLDSLYRAEIKAMDAYVGNLLDRLEKRGKLKNTLIVFVSDHGDELMDHRSLGHGHGVHDELLRVPLLMSLDGVLPAGLRISEPVELLDVAPTILDLLGLETPSAMQGRSLLPLIDGGGVPGDHPSLASTDFPSYQSIVYRDWKLIRGPILNQGRPPRLQLFNITTDPGEIEDVARAQPVIRAALAQMLDWELAGIEPPAKHDQDNDELSPAVRSNLEALGYIE